MKTETKIIKGQAIEYTYDDNGKCVKSRTLGPVDSDGNVIIKRKITINNGSSPNSKTHVSIDPLYDIEIKKYVTKLKSKAERKIND